MLLLKLSQFARAINCYIALFWEVLQLLRYVAIVPFNLGCVIHIQVLILVYRIFIRILNHWQGVHLPNFILLADVIHTYLPHFGFWNSAYKTWSFQVEFAVFEILLIFEKVCLFKVVFGMTPLNIPRYGVDHNILNLKHIYILFVFILCKYLGMYILIFVFYFTGDFLIFLLYFSVHTHVILADILNWVNKLLGV